MVPLQADFGGPLTVDVDAVAVGIVHRPGICCPGASGGPIARAVAFTECGDAFDFWPFLVEHLNLKDIRILTATDSVPFRIEQRSGHCEENLLDARGAEGVGGIDFVGIVAVAEVPKVRCAWCGEALELHWGVQTDRRWRCELSMGSRSNLHTLLKNLRATWPSDRQADVALSGALPLHFDRGRVLEGIDQGAFCDGPVIGVLVRIRRQDG